MLNNPININIMDNRALIGPVKNKPNQLRIHTKNKYLGRTFCYEIKDECIILRRPGIDDNVRILNPRLSHVDNSYTITINRGNNERPLGEYFFEVDEEEDELVIYFGD